MLLLPPVILLFGAYYASQRAKNAESFFIAVFAVCVLILAFYPARNYMQSIFFGNPCATKKLIVKQYSRGIPGEYQEVTNGVVCIAADVGYAETFQWQILNGADAKTFEYLGYGYSRDKNTVFYRGVPIDIRDYVNALEKYKISL